MGFFEKLFDDVSLTRTARNLKGIRKKTFSLQLTAKNKRVGVVLNDVQIIQLVPGWFDVIKKPKGVTVEGKSHKLIIWKVHTLKPREQKTITLSLRADGKSEGEIGVAHASYRKVIGKKEKQVYDGYIAGSMHIY